jgi:alcohol dehydrogenase class IV
MDAFAFNLPTRIVFGAGSIDTLAQHAHLLGARPLFVTGARFVRESGLRERLSAALPGAAWLEGIPENPTTTVCESGAQVAIEHGADVLIAVGGGSVIDAAKAIAVLAQNPPPCAQYFGADRYAAPPLPLIAVPTTAGTGSEVTPYSVLVDPEGPAKRTISGQALFPRLALLDPVLTCSLPRAVTVATGLDALSQAMEGMLSRKATPIGDTLALEACVLVRRALPRVLAAPNDLDARAALLHAALLSGIIIAQSGTTLVHGMGYYYTLHAGVAHGLANALLLAPVFRVNAQHAPDKVARIAAALGFPCAPTPTPAADGITQALHELLRACGVSPAARDAGVAEAALAGFAQDIAGDPYRFKNQWGTFDARAVEALFQDSHDGR